MGNDKLKFESPERIKELDPMGTLSLIGVTSDSTVCDYGAGTGIFTIPAAKMTSSKVYAVDIDPKMIEIIKSKVKDCGACNVVTILADKRLSGIEEDSVDNIILVTVFHELVDRALFFCDVKNMLNEKGIIGIIEFHKKKTPMGPPVGHRISKDEVISEFTNNEFMLDKNINLGDNFYMLTFRRTV